MKKVRLTKVAEPKGSELPCDMCAYIHITKVERKCRASRADQSRCSIAEGDVRVYREVTGGDH